MKIKVLQNHYCDNEAALISVPVESVDPGEKRIVGTSTFGFFPSTMEGVKPDSIQSEHPGRWKKIDFDFSMVDVVDDNFDFGSNNCVDVTSQPMIDLFSKYEIPFFMDELKRARFNEIDSRSSDLILTGGHIYGEKIFSLSITAQINLLGVESKKDLAGLYPLIFATIDDMDEVELNNSVEVSNFFMSALVAKKSILDGGNVLKRLIRASTTKTQLDLVVDNR